MFSAGDMNLGIRANGYNALVPDSSLQSAASRLRKAELLGIPFKLWW